MHEKPSCRRRRVTPALNNEDRWAAPGPAGPVGKNLHVKVDAGVEAELPDTDAGEKLGPRAPRGLYVDEGRTCPETQTSLSWRQTASPLIVSGSFLTKACEFLQTSVRAGSRHASLVKPFLLRVVATARREAGGLLASPWPE